MDFFIFRTPSTNDGVTLTSGTDNSAFDMADADAPFCSAVLRVSTFYDCADNSIGQENVGLAYEVPAV